jgi:Leucine-rich repeat (LRR) protein
MDLSTVWKLRVSEGLPQHLWASCTDAQQWTALFNLNLSSCGLVSLPSAIGQLAALHVLRLNHNKLTSLPQELGQLSELEVLSVNHNQLTTLPGRWSSSRPQEALRLTPPQEWLCS